MEVKFVLLQTLCWTLIVVRSAGTDSEVKTTTNAGFDAQNLSVVNNNSTLNKKNGELESAGDSNNDEQLKKGRDQVGRSKEGVGIDNMESQGNSIEQKQLATEEDHIDKKGEDGSVGKGDDKEKSSGDGSKSKVIKDKEVVVRKEGSRGEECDTSNSCKAENDTLVSCLRVPGNESPDLSLLIQNKGNGPLDVTIVAPDFVWLEKKKIQLQDKEDKKVKVSIRKGGTESWIVLTAGNDNCSLDFRDLNSFNFVTEMDHGTKSAYITYVKQTPFVAFFVFAALLVAASAWMCATFQRRHFIRNGSKYQKLDTELPISGGGKVESDLNSGWDNSWGDNWDDEEAPTTPSVPVTPSLSSKGLASRRLNKEGWKD